MRIGHLSLVVSLAAVLGGASGQPVGARLSHPAATLLDGQVLVANGGNGLPVVRGVAAGDEYRRSLATVPGHYPSA